ncbi:MAG TPA: Bax inhibitor-1 family protein [Tahibacter sp.]|uniref:Bax inhibitor-1/YccA family protein n=1 Tax=Tahibacter sp. TaxID=2056211 RepID=UPI002BE47A40|nr:Bax inhibitor-1 family protein [Tahibacter sp.]HSX62218.1 Bax inhibitor-1 family protein [Tahibacter sp.]
MDHIAQTHSDAGLDSRRIGFIRSAYLHLGGAIVAFTLLGVAFYLSGVGVAMLKLMGASKWAWIGFLGAFMVVGWLASSWADNADSNGKQLLGLAVYVVAEALIFAPILAIAGRIAPGAIGAAAFITLLLVGGLTFTAFTLKKDFSFLGGILKISGFVALGAILASVIFGFQLGVWFSAIMIIFAGGCVLYDTSNIIHHYPEDRPAGAALHLFASVALMFWYVLRLLMSFAGSDD